MSTIPPGAYMRGLSTDEVADLNAHIRALDDEYDDNVEETILISATTTILGIFAEYDHVESRHGHRNDGWRVESQILIKREGRCYDLLCIKLCGGEKKSYCFDITQLFGRSVVKNG